MKQIYYIVKAELQSLFYSPIAWLVLVIFTLQCAVTFSDTLASVTEHAAKGTRMPGLTYWFFFRDSWGAGVFIVAMRYLYIYFPLLTMGLISKELSSGSIKLLDSSPVSTSRIVWGKYLAMLVYSLLLLLSLGTGILICALSVDHFNLSYLGVGLLGMFLTMAVYSAIGLFFSSLTRYPVVAAIGSFSLMMVLERIGQYGQHWDGIREITTWLSMSGRTDLFMKGLLTSQNVIYFLGVITLFIGFTILKLTLARYHYSIWRKGLYYTGLFLAVVAIGWTTSLPRFRWYADVTENQSNTLASQSREVMEALKDKGKITITTYVNLMDPFRGLALPANISADKARFERYLRFKPDISFNYVYYYAPTDSPHNIRKLKPNLTFEETAREIARLSRVPFRIFKTKEEIDRIVDLEPERYRFVRFFELADGRKSALRIYDDIPPLPEEQEFAVAFKRLTVDMPRIGMVTGHGERSVSNRQLNGYEWFSSNIFFRFSLVNQGIDAVELSLEEEVPESLNILMIADPQTPFSGKEYEVLDRYIARGGHLILLVEPEKRETARPLLERFGVAMVPGMLAQPSQIELSNVVAGYLSEEAKAAWNFRGFSFPFSLVAMPGVAGLLPPSKSSGFKHIPVLITRPDAWNKTGRVDWIQGPIEPDNSLGETTASFLTAMVLSREINGKEQRIFIAGDSDWLNNRELRLGRQGFEGNAPTKFSALLFGWLTDGVAPMNIRRPPTTDVSIQLSQQDAVRVKWGLVWIIPTLLIAAGLFVLIRRSRY